MPFSLTSAIYHLSSGAFRSARSRATCFVSPLGVLLVELAVEHVILHLMPHDRLESITDAALIQFSERLANELERARVTLLTFVRCLGIPIESDRRSTDRRLDDGDCEWSLLPDASSKRHLKPEQPQRLQWNPTFRRPIAIPENVRLKDVLQRFACAFEVGIVINVNRMRVGYHHVGL